MFEITLLITSITKRIFPIGRLDKASEGLIFMTNDGDIVNKILRARNNHEKIYGNSKAHYRTFH
jgi:pseudouridine synthase